MLGGGLHPYLLNHGGRFYLSFRSVGGFPAERDVLRFAHFKFEIKTQPAVLSATSCTSQRAALHSLESSAGREVPNWIHV